MEDVPTRRKSGRMLSEFVDEQALKLTLAYHRWLTRVLIAWAVIFILLFLVTLTGRLVSFRFIGLFNGVYCSVFAVWLCWTDAGPDLAVIKRRSSYRVYLHTIFSVCAYVVFTAAQDENNKVLSELGALFIWPLSVALEGSSSGNPDVVFAYMVVHVAMTVVRCSGNFWSTGWQTILTSASANLLMFFLAQGRDAVLSDNYQMTSLCGTIKRLLRSMCDGYCVLDARGLIIGADIKFKDLLGLGMGEDSLINGRALEYFDEESTQTDCTLSTISEGLRIWRFRAGADSTIVADVYTVASDMTSAMISDIIGHKNLAMDGSIDGGFLCAVRHRSHTEQLSGHGESLMKCASEFEDGGKTGAGLCQPVQGDEFLTGIGIDAQTLAASELGDLDSVSVVDRISEANSFEAQSATGGLFPATKTIGIGIGEYTKVQLISRGAQGMVWKVHDSNGECFAMKELRLPGILWRRDFTGNLIRADREIRTLKRLQWASSVIVRIMDSWLQEDMTLHIVMEWLPLTLKSVLLSRQSQMQGPPPPDDTCRWMAHVVAGLAVIHAQSYMHRDLKPSNLLLTLDMHWCKIADLGLSRQVKQPGLGEVCDAGSSVCDSETPSMLSGHTAKCGTRGFQSPEILNGGRYGAETDIYSLGCVLFGLLSFTQPEALPITPKAAVELFPPNPLAAGQPCISSTALELQQLCLEMLKESVEERPTAPALVQAEVLKAPMLALLQEHHELGRVLGRSVLPEEQHEVSEGAIGFVTLDAHGLVRRWSPGISNLLGVPQEKALGRRLLEAFMPTADRAEFSRLVGPVVRGLSQEAEGPLTLQSSSRKLRLMAKLRSFAAPGPGCLKSGKRGASSNLGLLIELAPLRPSAAEASGQSTPLTLAKDSGRSGKDGPRRAAPAPSAQSAPASLVSQRATNTGGFDAQQGLHERHVRAWSVAEE